MKPILFNTDMVRAILDNRKSATRRPVKPQEYIDFDGKAHEFSGVQCGNFFVRADKQNVKMAIPKPYHPGDILYVRETWYYETHMEDFKDEADLPSGRYSHRYIFKADFPDYPVNVGVGHHGWRPSIHMPKEAARLFLRVTGVRAERLQNMTQEDAKREGFLETQDPESKFTSSPLLMFAGVWKKCYAAPRPVKENGIITHYESYPWEEIRETRTYKGLPWEVYGNPWVWAIEFERITKEEACHA